MVMELRQHAVTAFDSRGSTLKGVDLLRRPQVPLLQGLHWQSQRERMRVQCGPYRLACLPYLGFSARTACMGHMVLPIDPGQQQLPDPCPPGSGDGGLLQILLDACPPKIHEGGQGRQLVTDFFQGVVPYRELMALGSCFDRFNRRLELACHLGGSLGS